MARLPPTPPPFPTRRSSDLQARADPVDRVERTEALEDIERTREERSRAHQISGGLANGGSRLQRLGRSEEHTSELQSLRHLVCRLLLEKKKTVKGIKKEH